MSEYNLPNQSKMLKKDFLYGVATSSFQIEGGADERAKNIWDTFCEQKGKILDNSHGMIACDHYNIWEEDVDLINQMGFDAYRLSISWPRMINADRSVNSAGVNFYTQLLKSLKSKNIKTFVTLYHWDLPQFLEDEGGWLNRDTAYAFADYVNVAVDSFAGLVDSYATLNEPFCSAHLGYEVGVHAPGMTCQKSSRQAAHHLLLAHGLAMQILNKKSPQTQNGIVLNFTPCYPESSKDLSATELANQYINHWYAQPIIDGQYPPVIDMLPKDVQPTIQDSDMEIISQPIDFLGINFYTRNMCRDDGQGWYHEFTNENVEKTDIGWEIFPCAFSSLLTELNEKYKLPPIYITENGCAYHDEIENEKITDTARVNYYQSHLMSVHEAIEKGVNIKGYFAWSLMDNFEWAWGYSQRFGIVHVDYTTLKRTIKSSGYAFSKLIASRM